MVRLRREQGGRPDVVDGPEAQNRAETWLGRIQNLEVPDPSIDGLLFPQGVEAFTDTSGGYGSGEEMDRCRRLRCGGAIASIISCVLTVMSQCSG